MTEIYTTSRGEIIIEKIEGMKHFSKLVSEGRTILIDNLTVENLVKTKQWKIAEFAMDHAC